MYFSHKQNHGLNEPFSRQEPETDKNNKLPSVFKRKREGMEDRYIKQIFFPVTFCKATDLVAEYFL